MTVCYTTMFDKVFSTMTTGKERAKLIDFPCVSGIWEVQEHENGLVLQSSELAIMEREHRVKSLRAIKVRTFNNTFGKDLFLFKSKLEQSFINVFDKAGRKDRPNSMTLSSLDGKLVKVEIKFAKSFVNHYTIDLTTQVA